MPFFRLRQQLIYFAHVPKCAGTSVEAYLQRRFGALAFRDQFHYRDPGPRWTVTSPQHVTAADLERLIPVKYFAARFTVLRHPVPRLVSVFRFQRDWEQRIPPETRLSAWLEDLRAKGGADPHAFDNHLLPMSAFVPEGTDVFRLEEGLNPVIAWLDRLQGEELAPREMPVINTHGGLMAKRGSQPAPVTVTPADREMIAELYAEDFSRFGYDPASLPLERPRTEQPLPPKPKPRPSEPPIQETL